MQRFCTCLMISLLCCLAACGDGESPTEPKQEEGRPTAGNDQTPAAALDGQPAQRKNAGFAGRVAPFKLRRRADALELESLQIERPYTHPSMADAVAAAFRVQTVEKEQIPVAFREQRLSVRVVDLGERVKPWAIMKELQPSRFPQGFRNFVLDPMSPPAIIEKVRLFLVDDYLDGKCTAPFGLTSATTPSFETLEKAEKDGCKFWLVTDQEEDDLSVQAARPAHIRGANERRLPIPVVHIARLNNRWLGDTIHMAGHYWSIRVELEADDERLRKKAVVLSIEGNDPTKRVVVTAYRDRDALTTEAGSRSLGISAMAELARVLGIAYSNAKKFQLNHSLDIVHVMDDQTGFEFLDKIVKPGTTVLGVIDISGLASAARSASRIFVGYDGADHRLVEKALYDTSVKALKGQAGSAWKEIGFFAYGQPIPAAIAKKIGQERIPLVRLMGCGHSYKAERIEPFAGVQAGHWAARILDPRNGLAFTYKDRLSIITDKNVSRCILVTRVLILAVDQILHSPLSS